MNDVRLLVSTVLAVGVFALSGCAARVVSSSERTIMINAGSLQAAEAQNLANIECQKYQRAARLSMKPREDRQWVFDCER